MSVICHSFGTYVVSEILLNHTKFKWHRVIFAGSVVREDYNFEKAIDSFDDPLINEVGTRDFWPAFAESAGWGYGSVGTLPWNRPGTVTRFHKNFRHSDFLTPEFCQKYWVPFLRGEAPRAADDEMPMPIWVRLLAAAPLRWIILTVLLPIFITAAVYSFDAAYSLAARSKDETVLARFNSACERYPALCNMPWPARRDLNEHLESDYGPFGLPRSTPQVECFNGLGDCSSNNSKQKK